MYSRVLIKLKCSISFCFQTLFNPPLRGYDLLIWTHPNINTLRWLAANANAQSLPPLKQKSFNTLPIVDFHPVELYITELRVRMINLFLFLFFFFSTFIIERILKHVENPFNILHKF